MPIFPRGGMQRFVRHKKIVGQFLARRLLEREESTPCGLTPDITCLIVLSFPAASIA